MPTSRHHAASAVVGGEIYVIVGRLDSSYEGTDIVEIYDPVLDKWATDLEPMPSKRSGIAGTSIDGAIYVLGGERWQGPLIIMNDLILSIIRGPSKHQCQPHGMGWE